MTKQAVYAPESTAAPDQDEGPVRARVSALNVTVGVLVSLVIAVVVWSLFTNPRWEWGVFATYFLDGSVLKGLGLTLQLTFFTGLAGFLLGGVLAFMRMTSSRILNAAANFYIWIFRSVPLLVQMLLWYNFSYLYRYLSFTIPFTELSFYVDTTDIVDQYVAAFLGLALHQAAYSCELIRGGLLSVPRGQIEAADALGVSRRTISTRIVLPQAMRAIIPSAINEFISLLKGTSIVAVLSLMDVLYTVQTIYAKTQQVLPMLIVASVWYIVFTTLLTMIQHWLERRFSRGFGARGTRASRPALGALQRLSGAET